MIDFVIQDDVLIRYNGKSSHVVIPKNVKKLGNLVFYRCININSIKISKSVKEIGHQAFESCINLTRIEIPNSVKSIGYESFYGCNNLESIKISNSVTCVGNDVFRGIKKVKPQYNNNKLRAYKAFSYDWTCLKDFHYEVGKSYHQDGPIECCVNGFHACPNPLHVFNYYWGNLNERHFAEVELSGEMDWDNMHEKVAASDIKIIRELSVSELAEIYNNMEKE